MIIRAFKFINIYYNCIWNFNNSKIINLWTPLLLCEMALMLWIFENRYLFIIETVIRVRMCDREFFPHLSIERWWRLSTVDRFHVRWSYFLDFCFPILQFAIHGNGLSFNEMQIKGTHSIAFYLFSRRFVPVTDAVQENCRIWNMQIIGISTECTYIIL